MPGEPTDDGATLIDPQTGPTAPLTQVPAPSPMALVAAGRAPSQPSSQPSGASRSVSLTTAADAMRNEEVERTRLFIMMGWVISVITGGAIFYIDAPMWIAYVFVGGLAVGMVLSTYYYRAFADPLRYTETALVRLAMICVFNGHAGVLLFGTYSAAPILTVVGIHFVARTELERVARWVLISALVFYTAISLVLISGIVDDPGVFDSNRPVPKLSLVAATLFVLGTYVLAYYTARSFRSASLISIDELQRTTRLASQREALMDELRADLERALRVGGPGRYTDQVVGTFKLGIVLGRGAMGEVYEAAHVTSGAAAAVKLLRREQLSDPTQVARFLREVKASAAIDSPHIVRVLDAAAADDQLPYLAMERLHGQTLSELLRREPKLSASQTVELCRHTAIGIDALAGVGIVHRDLKPANLFQTADGVWKIIDFGVATLGDGSGTLTQGEAVGTPYYMAPEQAQGLKVDSRADVYALAAIAYRCLTGRYPFTGTDTPALLYAVVHRTPPRPGELVELPEDIDRWFAIALAKQPGDRFATGADAVDALIAAFGHKLDAKLRKRADALIRKHPWEAV
ncbi:MAG TPA: serine/threonine-protein kinase [Kofleriaceae bacterium]|nr:serine/threonine-protein kinase [Kofleriaceae bacterium]